MFQSRIFLILLAVLLLAGCSASSSEGTAPENQAAPVEVHGENVTTAGGEYTNISAAELQSMLDDKDFELINVHIPYQGDIPGTDSSIPYHEIDQHLGQLPEDKDAKLILYCRSDAMSTTAAERLVEMGYTNIWNLEGGMVAWERAGYSLEGR